MIPIKQIQKAPDTDDELLAVFMQSGSQQALATLYLRYSELAYGTCLKYLKDAEKAKDAVMNIYTELLQKLPHHEVNNFKSWLYVVIKNYCLMQLRQEKKMMVIEFQPQLMQSEDFVHLDEVLSKEADFKKLEACLQKLSEDQRQTVQYFYLENKCYKDIAAQTGLDCSRIRSLIQNGRRNLKLCMEEND